MNMTWLTGRITEEEMKHSHPEEYERLKGTAYEVHGADGVQGVAPEPAPAAAEKVPEKVG